MLSRKDRANLIKALNTGLALYVPKMHDRKQIVTLIAVEMELPHLDHFVEACTVEA